MELKVKHIILTAVFCFYSLLIFAQMQHPPEPRMDGGVPGEGPPCPVADDGDPETPIPPPVGLCLSINTYIYPLLVLGILFGAYRVIKVENANKTLEGK